jgi:hypothetical protein
VCFSMALQSCHTGRSAMWAWAQWINERFNRLFAAHGAVKIPISIWTWNLIGMFNSIDTFPSIHDGTSVHV